MNNGLGYSHLSNKRGGWNKHEGGAKFAKSTCQRFGNLFLFGLVRQHTPLIRTNMTKVGSNS